MHVSNVGNPNRLVTKLHVPRSTVAGQYSVEHSTAEGDGVGRIELEARGLVRGSTIDKTFSEGASEKAAVDKPGLLRNTLSRFRKLRPPFNKTSVADNSLVAHADGDPTRPRDKHSFPRYALGCLVSPKTSQAPSRRA